MKKHMVTLFAVMLILLGFSNLAFAGDYILEKNRLVLELDAGAGHMLPYQEEGKGGLSISGNPLLMYTVIEDLGIFLRFGWERSWQENEGGTEDLIMDAFPVLFGVRYYMELVERLHAFVGGGLGFAVIDFNGNYTKYANWDHTDTKFALNVHGGLQYELTDNFAMNGYFDILMPNLSPFKRYEEKIPARFAFLFGFTYYIPLSDDGAPRPPKDRDGDGIYDKDDKCPRKAEDKDGFQDSDGCPDPDNDNDGIKDKDDKCPNKAETKNDYEDNDGCPDEKPAPPAEPKERKIDISKNIQFETGSAVIKAASFPILDKVAEELKKFPKSNLRIEGHTDNVGKAENNKVLSQKRAEACLNYLVKKGIGKKRLSAVGFGQDQPVATNDTPEGRAKNRRVDFIVVEGY